MIKYICHKHTRRIKSNLRNYIIETKRTIYSGAREREKRKITDNVHEMYLWRERQLFIDIRIKSRPLRAFNIYLFNEKQMIYSKEIKLKVVVFRGDGERLGSKIFDESNEILQKKRRVLILTYLK
jgi:hypothetical protein